MYRILVIDVRNTIIHEKEIVDSVDACQAHNDAVEKYRSIKDDECPAFRVLFAEICMETKL
jgi:hypothetical protein